MATVKKSDQYTEKSSFVAQDMIWKDHVSKIEKSQRVFDRKWGFLQGQDQPVPADPWRSNRVSTNLFINNENDQINVSPSPRPIPVTSNRLIGWRTTDQRCSLEKYGKYARGQLSLHKKLKWPLEGFD